MSHTHVERLEDAGELIRAVSQADRIALDCEAAGFHRYSDRLCLVQLTAGGRTWTIDPLAFDPTELLREPLERRPCFLKVLSKEFYLNVFKM